MARTKGKVKTHKLSNVKLNEVSLVGKGDNPSAHVLLLKTKDEEIHDFAKDYQGDDKNTLLKEWYDDNISTILKGSDCTAETFDEIIQDRTLRDKIWDMIWTLQDSISSIINDDEVEDTNELVNTTVSQFQQAVSTLISGGNTMTKEELEKALKAEQDKVAELTKELEAAQAVNKAAKEPAADGTCKSCGAKLKKEDSIDKSALPEAVVKHIEAQEKINKENADKIAKMEEETLTKSCVEKAVSVPAIGSIESVSKLLVDISKHDSELAATAYALLKVANTRIVEGGLFKENGKDSDTTLKTATEQLDELAKKHAAEHNITYAKAYDHIYTTNHDLRKAYQEETRR